MMKKRLSTLWENASVLVKTHAPSASFPTFSSMSASAEFMRWLESVTAAAPTAYDTALDSVYNTTHVGGGNHRLFDGSHDIVSAWQKVRDVRPDDTFAQEVAGMAASLWKDVTTIKGLPFKSLELTSYEQWADAVAGIGIPGLDKTYLYDLMSFDAGEVLGAGIGAVGAIFFLDRHDKERLSEILGAMGVSSIITANAVLGIITIALAAYAYIVKKKEFDVSHAAKGTVLTSLSAALIAILGFPVLIELAIVIVVSILVRRFVLDNEALASFFAKQAKDYGVSMKEFSVAAVELLKLKLRNVG